MATGQNDKKTRKASQKGKGRASERRKETPDKPAPMPDVAPPDGEEKEDALILREAADLTGAESASTEGDPDGDLDAQAELEQASEELPATQLGSERYVLAGFFGAAIVATYVIGRMLHGIWLYVASKDWFSQSLPILASVPDDDKSTYSTIIGAIISAVLVYRMSRKPDLRTWADDVAAELAKVKWPTKKEVSNSIIVVIAASTVATLYLALLDRLWGFVTDIVYGGGS